MGPKTSDELTACESRGQKSSSPVSRKHPHGDEKQHPLATVSEPSTADHDEPYRNDELRQRRTFSELSGSMRKPYSRKIFIACGLVVLPMLAFTVAIVWVVFANRLERADCPYPELCPGSHLLNTTSSSMYYVDYSAGRLAFISSLSATISFALVSILMMIYAYTTASELLQSTEQDSRRDVLPSPYQVSILLRVLNAEILVLMELGWERLTRIFWNKERSRDRSSKSSASALQRPILMLTFCIAASILIQAADTYFHISIDSTVFVQVLPQVAGQYRYSRRLAPWCINRQGPGSENNKYFWSCSLQWNEETRMISLANNSHINDYVLGPLKDYALHYTDEEGAEFAIVGAAQAASQLDWKASSFAVSTKCAAMERNTCEMGEDLSMQTFNCTKERSGIDLKGRMTGYTTQYYYYDVHDYLKNAEPFWNDTIEGTAASKEDRLRVTDEDANSVFHNPFRHINVVSLLSDDEERRKVFADDPRVWPRYEGGLDHLWLLCNSTVWDVTYTAIGHEVTSLEKTKSNGTMTGIASASNFPIGFFAGEMSMGAVAASTESNADDFIATYARHLSLINSRTLAAQTVTDKALLAQVREQKIVTELPAAALWVLVVANVSFALIGIALAVIALRAASEDVHQVHTRLGIAGLAAALFEGIHAERVVSSDKELFSEENPEVRRKVFKKVGVRRTDTGGSSFMVMEV
ncbi:hypothetical protein M011DRAFT_460452 [Sporormia fimetaria CBS 119925]|uniref:Uncharacterized protein n=1 Tax=Sporormia fimetaria CBS 119925 TaxID=1340428 RepID=A0A6A6V305_9PLEO|nr:hypothetical protein M011DRAFT_460452 [Sporormia fimetaria CBS 119925]